jgi:hypothetical protein
VTSFFAVVLMPRAVGERQAMICYWTALAMYKRLCLLPFEVLFFEKTLFVSFFAISVRAGFAADVLGLVKQQEPHGETNALRIFIHRNCGLSSVAKRKQFIVLPRKQTAIYHFNWVLLENLP